MIYERVWIDNPEVAGIGEDPYGNLKYGLGHVRRVGPAILLERANAGLTRNRFFWISANLKKDSRGVDHINYGLGVETWDRTESNHHRHRPNWDFHHPKFRGLEGIIPAAATGDLWLETGPLKEYFNGHTSVALSATSTWRDRDNKLHVSPEINAAVRRVQEQINANNKRIKEESAAYNDALRVRLHRAHARISQGLPALEDTIVADDVFIKSVSEPLQEAPSLAEWFFQWFKKTP